jgi:hypothetical protein
MYGTLVPFVFAADIFGRREFVEEPDPCLGRVDEEQLRAGDESWLCIRSHLACLSSCKRECLCVLFLSFSLVAHVEFNFSNNRRVSLLLTHGLKHGNISNS